MKKPLLLLFVFGLSLTPHAQAEWAKSYSIPVPLGVNVSRNSARQDAIEQMRKHALDESGVYIQKITTLNEYGNVTEVIRTIQATMIQITDVVDRIYVGDDGEAVVVVNATARLDDKALAERIDRLQRGGYESSIRKLNAENRLLRLKYEQLSKLLTQEFNVDNAHYLTERNDLIQQLNGNRYAINQLLSGDEVFSRALNNQSLLSNIKEDVATRFYESVISSPFNIVVDLIETLPTGKNLLHAHIESNIKLSLLLGGLTDYFDITTFTVGNHPTPNVIRLLPKHSADKNITPMVNERLSYYLGSNPMFAHISIGSRRVSFPIFYPDTSFLGDCSSTRSGVIEVTALCVSMFDDRLGVGSFRVILTTAELPLLSTAVVNVGGAPRTASMEGSGSNLSDRY